MPPRKSSSCSTSARTIRSWRSALGPVSPSNCCCSTFPPDPSLGWMSRRKWSARLRPAMPTPCATVGRPALRLSGTVAIRRPDVRQGTRNQFRAGVVGAARWTAGDMARAQAWWRRSTRLHCQLRSAKHGVVNSLAAAGFAQAQMVDRSKLFCAIATKP
jgi:hypothetical protein